MSTAAPSANRGTVNSASSCAVRSRSRVVPILEVAEFSQASWLRVVNRSGGSRPLLLRNLAPAPAGWWADGLLPAEARPVRRRLSLPPFTLSASVQDVTPSVAQSAPEEAAVHQACGSNPRKYVHGHEESPGDDRPRREAEGARPV